LKDQNVIDKEPQDKKWNRALDLFTESVMKPDPELRQCSHNQKCFHELMYIREQILQYLPTLRKNETP
jgi:hypothetical protein